MNLLAITDRVLHGAPVRIGTSQPNIGPNTYLFRATHLAMNSRTLQEVRRAALKYAGIYNISSTVDRIAGSPILIDDDLADGEIKYLTELST